MAYDRSVDKQYVKSRLLALIDNLSDESLLQLLKTAETLPLKGNRKELRKVCLIAISVLTPEDRFRAVVHDISYSGIIVETEQPLRTGRDIVLVLNGPGISEPMELHGEVMRMNPRGIGVQFRNLDEDQDRMIRRLVDTL